MAATVVVFASAFLLGIASVAAAASQASSATSVFYGPAMIAGTYLCGTQRATVDNIEEGAYLTTQGWCNSSCSNPDSRPAGQLGAISYLWKGTSGSGGVLYGDSGWIYNSVLSQNSFATFYCPSGTCPSGAYYASGKGRFWNSDAQVYETSSFLSDSPNLNFP